MITSKLKLAITQFPLSQILKQYILLCCFIYLFIFLAPDMTRIFHACSVYREPAHLLFLSTPLASAAFYRRLPAFMGVIFLWTVTRRGALGLPPSLLSLTFSPPARNHVSNSVLLMKVCFSSLRGSLFCVP